MESIGVRGGAEIPGSAGDRPAGPCDDLEMDPVRGASQYESRGEREQPVASSAHGDRGCVGGGAAPVEMGLVGGGIGGGVSAVLFLFEVAAAHGAPVAAALCAGRSTRGDATGGDPAGVAGARAVPFPGEPRTAARLAELDAATDRTVEPFPRVAGGELFPRYGPVEQQGAVSGSRRARGGVRSGHNRYL